MLRNRLNYLLRHYFALSPQLQKLLVYYRILAENHSCHSTPTLQEDSVPLGSIPGNVAPHVRFIVPHTCSRESARGISFNDVNFFDMHIRSWFVPFPPVSETNALFNRCLASYTAKHLNLRLPFMGTSSMHCAHMSETGHICASNGFYNYVIDTNSRLFRMFPEDFLESEPMFYSKQGNFSSDGCSWYFVRWPMKGWVDILEKRSDSLPCQVGRYNLQDHKEEFLLTLDFVEDVHDIACSPDDKYAVFSSLKQELVLPFPPSTYFRSLDRYQQSHQSGVKLQDVITVDLKTLTYWHTKIPAPVVGHCVFDPDEPHVFYLSAHNIVYHQLSVFLEGPGTLFRLRIERGRTLIENEYSDEDFLRIFQHEVFKYRNVTYLAVVSYTNHLYILRASDLSLYKKVRIGPPTDADFHLTGNSLCLNGGSAYFTVNASDDGRFLIMGSATNFIMFDMDNYRLIPMDSVFPAGFGQGANLPHTRTYGK